MRDQVPFTATQAAIRADLAGVVIEALQSDGAVVLSVEHGKGPLGASKIDVHAYALDGAGEPHGVIVTIYCDQRTEEKVEAELRRKEHAASLRERLEQVRGVDEVEATSEQVTIDEAPGNEQ